MGKILKIGCLYPFILLFGASFVIALIEMIFDVQIIERQPDSTKTEVTTQKEERKYDEINTAMAFVADSTKPLAVEAHKESEPWKIQAVPNTRLRGNHIHVSDPENIIGAAYCDSINRILSEVRDSADIFVVALNKIDNQSGDAFTHELFNYWGIGDKDKNNGVLMLMTLEPHFFRIETGYGMEGTLTDAMCSRIMRHKIRPLFKEDKYPEGLLEGVKGVAAVVSPDSTGRRVALVAQMDATDKQEAERIEQIKKQDEKEAEEQADFVLKCLAWLSLGIWLIATFFKMKSHVKVYKDAKNRAATSTTKDANKRLHIETTALNGTSDFSWTMLFIPLSLLTFIPLKLLAKKKRREKRICPHCNKKMRKLSEDEEDKFLSKRQQKEESVKSKDYDVWYCDDCEATVIEDYAGDSIGNYRRCKSCGAQLAKFYDEEVMVESTTRTRGTKRTRYKCLHCGSFLSFTTSLPKKTDYSSYSSSGSSSSSYSSSSSSSSSSSGSFGGGSSGGGGSSMSW